MSISSSLTQAIIPTNGYSTTVTSAVAVKLPHVAVIVAVPSFRAVNLPLSTDTTLSSDVDHTTFLLSVVSAGTKSTVNVFVCPFTNLLLFHQVQFLSLGFLHYSTCC